MPAIIVVAQPVERRSDSQLITYSDIPVPGFENKLSEPSQSSMEVSAIR